MNTSEQLRKRQERIARKQAVNPKKTVGEILSILADEEDMAKKDGSVDPPTVPEPKSLVEILRGIRNRSRSRK